MSSPETVVGKRGRRGSRRTTVTVGSQAPVTAGVALGFRQRSEAPHIPQATGPSGRPSATMAGVAAKAKEFRYAVDLGEGDVVRTEDGTPLGGGPEWTPEHLLLAGLLRCSLTSLRYHARRAGIEVGEGDRLRQGALRAARATAASRSPRWSSSSTSGSSLSPERRS